MTRAKVQKTEESSAVDKRNHINQLPDELLLKILQQLAKLPPDGCPECDYCLASRFPFKNLESAYEPHPGLRSYPFLGQVCKHWQRVLETPEARLTVWDEVVIDFGHELITAVHTPIAWSDTRPSDEEFKASFSKTKLDASKILRFITERRPSLRRVTLMSSEGYYSEEGDFVTLKSKHDFTMSSFGMLCGLLLGRLEELTIMRCSDFFDVNAGGLDTIACLPSLRALRIEDLQCRLSQESVAKLSKLTQLTELSLAIQYPSNSYNWLTGLEKIPSAWSNLRSLEHLALRGHAHLTMLPHFLLKLPIAHLDIGYNKLLNFELIGHMSRLRTLCMQGLNLTESLPGHDHLDDELPPRLLPDISGLKNLTALNLSENRLTCVPLMLSKLTNLRYLDISANEELKVPRPLHQLHNLSSLRLVDMRLIHIEKAINYWSEEKCETMSHVSVWQKLMKRRGSHLKVLLDTDR